MSEQESTQLDDKITQVFQCHRCEPPIYMTVNFHAKIACLRVDVKCPYCGHEHPRTIKYGQVMDDRKGGDNREVIIVMKSACSTTDPMKKIKITNHGDGNIIPMDAYREAGRQQWSRERWIEKAESEKGNL